MAQLTDGDPNDGYGDQPSFHKDFRIAAMRLRNRILIGLVTLVIASGVGLAVAGLPRSISLDPILNESLVATTSTTPRPAISVPNPGSVPGSIPESSTAPSPAPAPSTTVNREWLIEILNAGAGPGGASRVADSLDLSLVNQIRLADAPNPQEQSLIIFRSQASGLMEELVDANPLLNTLERTEVDEWPQWADPSAVIVILVTADWPLNSAQPDE
jgi:hypothetical protein